MLPPDVLADDPRHRREVPPHVPVAGELLEVDGFVGRVSGCDAREVTLLDRRGRRRRFPLDGQLAYRGDRPVRLRPPAARPGRASSRPGPHPPGVTASGSVAAPTRAARVARASRIWVEGLHDAALLEAVWGDDLRDLGIVVEPLHGADDLADAVRAFAPGPGRRLGVLLDHLVPGSKEQRIAAGVVDPHVLVVGHPFVDVWAAVRPERLGLPEWPQVPRGVPWKEGIAAALGVGDVPAAWGRVRGAVRDWHDLRRPLVRAVEELLDFVSAAP